MERIIEPPKDPQMLELCRQDYWHSYLSMVNTFNHSTSDPEKTA